MPVLTEGLNQKSALFRNAERDITENSMLDYGSRVLVGVSGGPDSVALVHILIELGKKNDYSIGIAHINHGMRGKSADNDALFVESLAKRLNVPYCEKRIELFEICRQTGKCMEEAGRDARYAFFNEIADQQGFDRIAVGHHQEDDAELILMNIIRGSGPSGMGGIAPVRGRIVRPLIHCRRKEILSFLESEKIEYVLDRTNDDTRFHRNHVRHCLIPALEYYNPRVVENLHRLATISGQENEWVDSLVVPVFDAVSQREKRRLVIDINKIADFHIAAKRRLIRKAAAEIKGDLKRIGFVHIDGVIDLMEKSEPSGEFHLPDRLCVTRIGNQLIFTKEEHPLRRRGESPFFAMRGARYDYKVSREQAISGKIDIKETNAIIVFNRVSVESVHDLPAGDMAAFDWDRLEFPLCVRNMRPGDRFTPLGMKGTQKLKDFFINNKVPADKRGHVPILTSGGRVAWIAGLRMDDRFKITGQTRTALTVNCIEGTNH